jgi:hypothetical protein
MVVGPTGISAGVSATCNVIPGFGVTQNGFPVAPTPAIATVTPVRVVSPIAGPSELWFTVKNNSTTKPIFAQFVGYNAFNTNPAATFNNYFLTASGVTGRAAGNTLGSLDVTATGWGSTFTYPLASSGKTIIPGSTAATINTCLLSSSWSTSSWNATTFNTYLFVNDNGGETGNIVFASAATPFDRVLNLALPATPANTEALTLTYPTPITMQAVIASPATLPLYSIPTGRSGPAVYTFVIVSGTTILGTISQTVSTTPVAKVGTSATILYDVKNGASNFVSSLPSGTVCDVYLKLWGVGVKKFTGLATWYGNTFKFSKPTVTGPAITPFLQLGSIVIQNPRDSTGASDYNLADTIDSLSRLSGESIGGGTGGSSSFNMTVNVERGPTEPVASTYVVRTDLTKVLQAIVNALAINPTALGDIVSQS